MPRREASVTGPLWVQDSGAGPPVLLLHGLGASAHYWDPVMAATAGRHLVAPDLLGFGRSPAPAGAAYDVACHLEALRPLVRLGTLVVGHSTGGILAAALAAQVPDLVSGLLLVGMPVFPDEAAAVAGIGGLGLVARLTVADNILGRLLCIAMCRFRPVAIAAAPLLVRDMPRSVAADGARHTWSSYSRTLRRVVVEHRVAPDLERVRAPVAFLHGDRDPTARLANVEALVRTLDRDGRCATLSVVRGDHHLPVRRPAVVAQTIVQLGP